MDSPICLYNCCSVVNSIDVVRELTTREIDIIFLQETFITDDKLGIFDFIDENCESVVEGAVYSERAIATAAGRLQGGIACLWRSGSSFNPFSSSPLSINLAEKSQAFFPPATKVFLESL